MAQLWQVPLVLVCENNGWAISVPTALSQATPDVADRARGFGMPASVVDGNGNKKAAYDSTLAALNVGNPTSPPPTSPPPTTPPPTSPPPTSNDARS